MATIATTMTGAQFDALPFEEGRRWELVEGELVPASSPNWEHQRIGLHCVNAFEQHLKTSGMKGATAQEIEFALSVNDRLRPDVCVLVGDKVDGLNRLKSPVNGAPDIAVEIISPSESANDSHEKVRRYLRNGTSEVWQLYPKSRSAQIHRGNSATFIGPEGVITSDLLPGLAIPVASLFEP